MDVTQGFAELFEGRKDAYGRDEGGCARVHPTEFKQCWTRHLNGIEPIGVFPMVQTNPGENWTVKWGCVDLDVRSEHHPSGDYPDEETCHTAAVNVQRVLKHLGVTSWIERTRSGGRHIWVFADTWLPASAMRRSLLLASNVAHTSTREINPKQETLAEGQVGSYVRLPFPGVMHKPIGNDSTQVIVDDVGCLLDFGYVVHEALARRTSPQVLESIASKWREPGRAKQIEYFSIDQSVPVEVLLRSLNRAGRAVWNTGPLDGDRSKAMGYVAYQARQSGLSPSQALTLIAAATWQKFKGRADEEQRLREIVTRAWQ